MPEVSSFWGNVLDLMGNFRGGSETLQNELTDHIEEFDSSVEETIKQIRDLISKTKNTIERQLVEFKKPISTEKNKTILKHLMDLSEKENIAKPFVSFQTQNDFRVYILKIC